MEKKEVVRENTGDNVVVVVTARNQGVLKFVEPRESMGVR